MFTLDSMLCTNVYKHYGIWNNLINSPVWPSSRLPFSLPKENLVCLNHLQSHCFTDIPPMLKSFVRWTEVVFWLSASCRANFPSAVAGLDLESPEPSNLHIHFLFTLCAVAWAFQTTGGTKVRLVRKRGRNTDRCRVAESLQLVKRNVASHVLV